MQFKLYSSYGAGPVSDETGHVADETVPEVDDLDHILNYTFSWGGCF